VAASSLVSVRLRVEPVVIFLLRQAQLLRPVPMGVL
jgi:hypothetical protein